jgi:hypothetical protein
VSSFLSRRSNESAEIKQHSKAKTPSSVAAVDELEGMWTSYILCPDAGVVDSGGSSVVEAEPHSQPEGDVDFHGLKTAEKAEEAVQSTTAGSCVGVDNVEIHVGDNIAGGGDWLAAALRQRAELQEFEKSH